jgi:DNA-binding response OmpR family regulator
MTMRLTKGGLPSRESKAQKKRILVVEDNEDIGLLYTLIIEKKGYEVLLTLHGFEAIKKIYSFNPDLIVFDIMMPQVDGWELAKKIRTELNLKIPIIVVSVMGLFEDKIKSIEGMGVNRHLVKPIDNAELVNTIEILIEEH